MAQADIPKSIKGHTGNGSIKDYSEISDIQRDLASLKESVMSLSKHLKTDGQQKAEELSVAMRESLDGLLSKGDDSLSALEAQIKSNPRKSIVMAFAAGFVLNFLLRKG